MPTWNLGLKASAFVFLFSLAHGGTSVPAAIIFLGKCAGVDRSMADAVIPLQN